MKYEDITKRIIAASMKVHSTLGNGFQEVIYQRALEIEMPYWQLAFKREMEMPVFYRNTQIGTRRVDFFVEDLIMTELKAVIKLEDVHIAQAMNYLEAYNTDRRNVTIQSSLTHLALTFLFIGIIPEWFWLNL